MNGEKRALVFFILWQAYFFSRMALSILNSRVRKLFHRIAIFLVGIGSFFYGLFRYKLDPKANFNHWVRVSQFLMFCILGVLLIQSKWEFRNVFFYYGLLFALCFYSPNENYFKMLFCYSQQ